jgi:hypothetical protein
VCVCVSQSRWRMTNTRRFCLDTNPGSDTQQLGVNTWLQNAIVTVSIQTATAHSVPQPNDVKTPHRRCVCNARPLYYLFITLLLPRDQTIGGCSHFFQLDINTPRRDTDTNDSILTIFNTPFWNGWTIDKHRPNRSVLLLSRLSIQIIFEFFVSSTVT